MILYVHNTSKNRVSLRLVDLVLLLINFAFSLNSTFVHELPQHLVIIRLNKSKSSKFGLYDLFVISKGPSFLDLVILATINAGCRHIMPVFVSYLIITIS